MDKKCSRCMEVYPSGHWVALRSKCPACGGELTAAQSDDAAGLVYEHYDSSTDIKFDMDDLLSPDQRHEALLLLCLGAGLVLVAFSLRIGFVVLGGFQGFWIVPWWFDLIIVIMLILAILMIVWAARRLIRNRNRLQRNS